MTYFVRCWNFINGETINEITHSFIHKNHHHRHQYRVTLVLESIAVIANCRHHRGDA